MDDKAGIKNRKDNLLEGSCAWILRDPAYVKWVTSKCSDILWIHGGPGKGKTMIAISLVEALQSNISGGVSPQSLLAYFFCDNSNDKRNTALSIMKSLLYQILSRQPGLLSLLRQEFAIQKDQLFSSTEAMWRILHNVLKNSSLREVYFVVDGLDECDVNALGGFLSLLKLPPLQDPTDSQVDQFCKIKWLLTSRPEIYIKEHFARYLGIDLEMNSTQVAEAVSGFINFKVKELALEKRYDSELKNFVEETLCRKAEGTFLWVALACRELRTVHSINAKSYLLDLPSGLPELYRRIMEQIRNNKDGELVTFALEMLRSVTIAFRPLTLEELAVTAGLPKEVHYNLEILTKYVNQCGSFLTIRQNTVYFVHQSARDYFLSPENAAIFSPELGEENRRIATRCFQYICTDAFAELPKTRTHQAEDLKTAEGTSSYLEYPALHWMEHGSAASPDIADDINLKDEFFQPNSKLRLAWFHVYWEKRGKNMTEPYNFTPLHLAAFSGLLWLAAKLLDSGHEADVNISDITGRMPLHWAAKNGHEAVVRLLLEHKANVNTTDSMGWTALYWAIRNEHVAVVRLLLEHKAQVNVKGDYGWTALQSAAENNQEAVVRLLLEHKADIDVMGCSGLTALHQAAMRGHEVVVRLLLEHKADADGKNSPRQPPLHWAADNGHETVVRLLLEHNADVEAKNGLGRTALHLAAGNKHEALVRLLLEHKADVDAKDRLGQMALPLAARDGYEAAVQLPQATADPPSHAVLPPLCGEIIGSSSSI